MPQVVYVITDGMLLLLSGFSPTLYDPIDGSPPGSSVPGIFQARVLEWGAIAFSDTDYYDILILIPHS